MKIPTAFTFAFTMLLAACAPVIPGSGGSTPMAITAQASTAMAEASPIVITAEASTVIAETPGPTPTEGPPPTSVPPTPIPTLSPDLSPTELKYRVLAEFPDFFFCDPDFYPVARDDETVLAQQRFPELQSNQEEFQSVLRHNGLGGQTSFTDEQKLLVYREHKRLNAIYFTLVEDKYQFQIQTGQEGQQGTVITATIDRNGSIAVRQSDPGFPTCPICLAAGTLIDTPAGPVAVETLHIGDPVWTANEAGERVSGIILKTARARVPSSHRIVHILLGDGRELWASPGHPTADGRRLGTLRVGDFLDKAPVNLIELLPYTGIATYDLLPSGSTGSYWANGILMGSTLTGR
jgi:hypothetical protein